MFKKVSSTVQKIKQKENIICFDTGDGKLISTEKKTITRVRARKMIEMHFVYKYPLS